MLVVSLIGSIYASRLNVVVSKSGNAEQMTVVDYGTVFARICGPFANC
jgi:hypothetical protein